MKGHDMREMKLQFMYDETKKKKYVILKYNDFEKLLDLYEDAFDYQVVKKHGGKKGKTFSFDEVMAERKKMSSKRG